MNKMYPKGALVERTGPTIAHEKMYNGTTYVVDYCTNNGSIYLEGNTNEYSSDLFQLVTAGQPYGVTFINNEENNQIPGEIVGSIDIDGTILDWGRGTGRIVTFIHPFTNQELKVSVNEANLQVVTNWLARGATLLVWSRSGRAWANAALKAINLYHKNIFVAAKPLFYVDDKPANEWMGEQVFLPHTDKWGTGLKDD